MVIKPRSTRKTMINENEFFRQATIRICGSLDIKKAMRNCLDYIKDFIPVDMMNLRVYDPNLNLLHSVATVIRTDAMDNASVMAMPARPLKERIEKWENIKAIEHCNIHGLWSN